LIVVRQVSQRNKGNADAFLNNLDSPTGNIPNFCLKRRNLVLLFAFGFFPDGKFVAYKKGQGIRIIMDVQK
jgi:hypothetical protein